MKHPYFILFIFLFICFSGHGQNWQQVWSDEFDGPDISSANWQFETGGGGWGNSELENYTSRKDNATISNGNLLIIGKQENYQSSSYTSARMKTEGLHSWTYGKVEARIKIPTGQGTWPAFWMLGADIETVNWPACGEIDIMEHIDNAATIEGTIHWDNNGHVSYGNPVSYTPGVYHTYSIEWDNASIKWLLDDTQYAAATIANNVNSTEEFHKPFFILLNLAIGGSWPLNPDKTTIFPDTMFVDYVRVYNNTITAVNGASGVNSVSLQYLSALEMLNIRSDNAEAMQFGVYDFQGRKQAQFSATGNTKVSMQFLPKGIYFIKSDGGENLSLKFLKE